MWTYTLNCANAFSQFTIVTGGRELLIGKKIGPGVKTDSAHFSNVGCFFERFFAQNNSNVLVEWFFTCFRHF